MRKRAVNGKKKTPRSTKRIPKEMRIRFVMLITIPPNINYLQIYIKGHATILINNKHNMHFFP
jgi:hypothetical protein